MGELAVCKILWDKQGAVTRLKAAAMPYPAALKEALLSFFTFEAGFSLALAEKSAVSGDVYYVAAHLVRSLSALNQVLFALNETYCINEKRAVEMVSHFAISPAHYKQKVAGVFESLGASCPAACRKLRRLSGEVAALAP